MAPVILAVVWVVILYLTSVAILYLTPVAPENLVVVWAVHLLAWSLSLHLTTVVLVTMAVAGAINQVALVTLAVGEVVISVLAVNVLAPVVSAVVLLAMAVVVVILKAANGGLVLLVFLNRLMETRAGLIILRMDLSFPNPGDLTCWPTLKAMKLITFPPRISLAVKTLRIFWSVLRMDIC